MQNKINVYEAIKYFTKRHQNSKQGIYQIIISLLGISYSLYKIYKYERKNKKIDDQLNQLSIQRPQTPKGFQDIHQALKTEGIHSEYLYLKNQYEKKNGAHYYKNIFLEGEMTGPRMQNYLGILDASFDSNEYYCGGLPNHMIRKLDSQGFKRYQFSGCPISVSGTILYDSDIKYPTQLEADNSIGKWYVANLFVSLFLGLNQVWIKGIRIPVTVNTWFEPNQKFVIGCDVMILKGQMRISNVRSIGKTFTSLKCELIKYYKDQIERNQRSIFVAKLGLAVCLISLAYFGIQKINSYLTQWAYSKEYPRVDEVSTKLKQAKLIVGVTQQTKFLICKTCSKNLINVVFIPCYHMQSCLQCLETQAIMCLACDELVYSGVPLYTNL
ncbi:hypothetical protein pb186bvf_017992 [Paramecium bursaria]